MLLLPAATWVAMRARAPLSESPKEKDQELESYMYPIYYHVPRYTPMLTTAPPKNSPRVASVKFSPASTSGPSIHDESRGQTSRASALSGSIFSLQPNSSLGCERALNACAIPYLDERVVGRGDEVAADDAHAYDAAVMPSQRALAFP